METTIPERLDRMVDGWCEQRHLDALRVLLPAWPVVQNLTDHWARVFEALKTVRERASADFDAAEKNELDELILEVGRIVYR